MSVIREESSREMLQTQTLEEENPSLAQSATTKGTKKGKESESQVESQEASQDSKKQVQVLDQVKQEDADQVHQVWGSIGLGHTSQREQSPDKEHQHTEDQPTPRDQQDYIRVFEQLLRQALETQSNFSFYLEEQENVPFMASALSIDGHNTKSFKDLCVRLVEQVKALSEAYMQTHQQMTKSREQNEELQVKLKNYKVQIQELFDSQAEENKLQEQIQESRIQELKTKHAQQINSVKNLQESQALNFQSLIESHKSRMTKLQGDNRKLQEQLAKTQAERDSPQFAKTVSAQFEKENLEKMNHLLNQKVKILQHEVERLIEQVGKEQKEKQQLIEKGQESTAGGKAVQLRDDLLQTENFNLNKKLVNVESEKQALQQQLVQQKQMLENMTVMYNLQQQNQEHRQGVAEGLKLQYQEQVTGNLELEAKCSRQIELLEKQLKERDDHLATVKKQLEFKSEESTREIVEFKTKFQKSGQEHARLAVDLQKDIERLRLENCGLNQDLEKSRDDLSSAKERIRELAAANQAHLGQQDDCRERLAYLAEQHDGLLGQVKDQEWVSKQVEEVGISLVMTKDSGHYNLPLQVPAETRHTKSGSAGGRRAQSRGLQVNNQWNAMQEMCNQYASQFQGVNCYAQAVCQANLIEKFLKSDKQQQAEARRQAQRLQQLEREISQVNADVRKVQEEKQKVEQLILEVLSFGEQCDQQFDKLQAKFTKYEADDKQDVEHNLKLLARIKGHISEQLKQVIVDIEDHSLRDQLLEVLTKLSSKTLQYDQAISQIMDTLVTRVREMLIREGAYKHQIDELKDNQELVRELEQQKGQTVAQLEEELQEHDKSLEMFGSLKSKVKEVTRIVDQYERQMHGVQKKDKASRKKKVDDDLETEPSKRTEEDEVQKTRGARAAKLYDALCQGLTTTREWALEQKRELPRIIKERGRVLELNLKINSLVQENSLLGIQNDKYLMINKKFKENVPAMAVQSPLRSKSLGTRASFSPDCIKSSRPGSLDRTAMDQPSQTRSNSTHSRPALASKRERPTKPESQGGGASRKQNRSERLQHILTRVQDLKGEFSGQDPPPQQSAKKHRDARQGGNHGHHVATGSSFYDQRGQYDLQSQQQLNKMSSRLQEMEHPELLQSVEKDLRGVRGILINEQSTNFKDGRTHKEHRAYQQVATPEEMTISEGHQLPNEKWDNRLHIDDNQVPQRLENHNSHQVLRPQYGPGLAFDDPATFSNERHHTMQNMLYSHRRPVDSSPSGDELQATSQFNPVLLAHQPVVNSKRRDPHGTRRDSSRRSQSKKKKASKNKSKRKDDNAGWEPNHDQQEQLSNPGITYIPSGVQSTKKRKSKPRGARQGQQTALRSRKKGEGVAAREGRETAQNGHHAVMPCYSYRYRSHSQGRSQGSSLRSSVPPSARSKRGSSTRRSQRSASEISQSARSFGRRSVVSCHNGTSPQHEGGTVNLAVGAQIGDKPAPLRRRSREKKPAKVEQQQRLQLKNYRQRDYSGSQRSRDGSVGSSSIIPYAQLRVQSKTRKTTTHFTSHFARQQSEQHPVLIYTPREQADNQGSQPQSLHVPPYSTNLNSIASNETLPQQHAKTVPHQTAQTTYQHSYQQSLQELKPESPERLGLMPQTLDDPHVAKGAKHERRRAQRPHVALRASTRKEKGHKDGAQSLNNYINLRSRSRSKNNSLDSLDRETAAIEGESRNTSYLQRPGGQLTTFASSNLQREKIQHINELLYRQDQLLQNNNSCKSSKLRQSSNEQPGQSKLGSHQGSDVTTERVWNAKQPRLKAPASNDLSLQMQSQVFPLSHQFQDQGSPPTLPKQPTTTQHSKMPSFDIYSPPDQRQLQGTASQPHQAQHMSNLLNSSICTSDVMATVNQSMIPVELGDSAMFSGPAKQDTFNKQVGKHLKQEEHTTSRRMNESLHHHSDYVLSPELFHPHNHHYNQ